MSQMLSVPVRKTLRVVFHGSWHAGSGHAAGRHLDATSDRDGDGLPMVSGRHIKGMLREAAECLQAWGHWRPGSVQGLFGGPVADGDSRSQPGLIAVSSAVLPPPERQWLGQQTADARRLRQALYFEQAQTAIDERSGVARDGSLRTLERVVPLELHAEVEVLAAAHGQASRVWRELSELLPLVRALGAERTRGQGRVSLSWAPGGQP